MQRTLEFDGQTFPYCWWNGQQLKGTVDRPLAYDSETAAIPPYRTPLPDEDPLTLPTSSLIVPPVAVGLAYDGEQLVLIHPSRLKDFVAKHRSQQVVGHNFSFDFHVLLKHFRDGGDKLSEEFLFRMGDDNRLCDTAILDLLLQLGSGVYRIGKGKKGKAAGGDDKKLLMTNLGELSAEWGCGELDKTDPYRLRFGEWVGLSEEEIEAHPEFDGFAQYALKDVVVTQRIYPLQRQKGIEIMKRAGWSDRPGQKTFEIRPDALKLFGCLSEYVQVKGAIVLDGLSKTPLYIDQEKRAELEKGTRERYQKNMDALMEMMPELFKRYSPKARNGNAGKIRVNKKTGLPEMSTLMLKGRLECEAETLNITPPVSKGKNKAISCSTKDWVHLADQSPFLEAWCGLGSEVKLLSFFLSLDAADGKTYSSYNLLMRNGRTSAQSHKRGGNLLAPSFNIQQMPRESADHPERSVRSLFMAPPGHRWGSYDYSYVELRSLAAVCRARFGWSKLGDVIDEHYHKGGCDPHQVMAASILRVTPEQFLALDKKLQKEYRQRGKACGFGYPGGLGINSFLLYAAQNYGVNFTPAEAKETKTQWLERFPEMKLYLTDPTELAMKWQADKTVAPKMDFFRRLRLSQYLKATDKERSEKTYSEWELDSFWDILNWIAKSKGDAELSEDISERRVSPKVRNLTTYRACTLTGRVRNNVTFTAGANTPFSSAAADGAKCCLWTLMRKGIHILGFVHDSVEVAIPKGKEKSIEPVVKKVMIDSMQYVLGQNVPVAVDGGVSDVWSKA